MSDTLDGQHKLLAKRFKQFRMQMGKTQTEFGELLGLTQTTVAHIESGKNDVTTRTLYALFDLQCNPMWLLLGEGSMLRTAEKGPTVEVKNKGRITEYIIRVDN